MKDFDSIYGTNGQCVGDDGDNRMINNQNPSLESTSGNNSERDSSATNEKHHTDVKRVFVRSYDDTCDDFSYKAGTGDGFFSQSDSNDGNNNTGESNCERKCPTSNEEQLLSDSNEEQLLSDSIVSIDGTTPNLNDDISSRDIDMTKSAVILTSGIDDEDNVSEIDCAVYEDDKTFSTDNDTNMDGHGTTNSQCDGNETVSLKSFTVIDTDNDDTGDSIPVLPDAESCEDMNNFSGADISTAQDKEEPENEIDDNSSDDEHFPNELECVSSGVNDNNDATDDNIVVGDGVVRGCGDSCEDKSYPNDDMDNENEHEFHVHVNGTQSRTIVEGHTQMATEQLSEMESSVFVAASNKLDSGKLNH